MNIPVIPIVIKQYDCNGHIETLELPYALVDTGAERSFINKDVIPENMTVTPLEIPETISNAFDNLIGEISGSLRGNLFIENSNIEIPRVEFRITEVPMKYNVIIGMDILYKFKID